MSKSKSELSYTDGDIRAVIWLLKNGGTKKRACEQLRIAYNTKRLDNIIEEFNNRIERTEKLKKDARSKELTDENKKEISNSYLSGESISSIATRLY
ncbi:MAG: hypothetical protein ACRENO_05860, partial [Thermodesulfobacteriota bacterium]